MQWLTLEVTYGNDPVQPLVKVGPSRASYTEPSQTNFGFLSSKEETSRPLQAIYAHMFFSLTVKCFVMFRENLLCFSLCPLSCFLSPKPLLRAWVCLLCTLSSDIYKHC